MLQRCIVASGSIGRRVTCTIRSNRSACLVRSIVTSSGSGAESDNTTLPQPPPITPKQPTSATATQTTSPTPQPTITVKRELPHPRRPSAAATTVSSHKSSRAASSICPPTSSSFESSVCEFQSNYKKLLTDEPFHWHALHKPETRDQEVFANADLPLSRINAYGFDYDYTLATYNDNVSIRIFKLAQDFLVTRMGYPAEITKHEFDKDFAIRGLHFDTRTGFLLKLDQHAKVQTATVYKGRQQVNVLDIVEAYRGVSITKDYRMKYLHQMVDLFALSETNLLADIMETFIEQKLDYSPDYIYRDVRRAIEHVHASGELHNAISEKPSVFLDKSLKLGEYLLRLREGGKLTFLLTNSPFGFVDAGMRYMLSDVASLPLAGKFGISDPSQWKELFDIVITSARKPAFFTREGQFRRVDPTTSRLSWEPVREFRRGEVYTEGSLQEFTRLTSMFANTTYRGHNVIYFGDHIGADLTAPWQTAKWRTVAIVRELQHEIRVQSTQEFKSLLKTQLRIEALIDYGQRLHGDEDTMKKLLSLKRDRQVIKKKLLTMFNPSFGSVFRTSLHRTEFFESVGRFADIYTSSIDNFLNYSLQHTFYAGRRFWPHEEPLAINENTSSSTSMSHNE